MIGSALLPAVAPVWTLTRSTTKNPAKRLAFAAEDFGPADSLVSLYNAVQVYRSILEDRADVIVEDAKSSLETFQQ